MRLPKRLRRRGRRRRRGRAEEDAGGRAGGSGDEWQRRRSGQATGSAREQAFFLSTHATSALSLTLSSEEAPQLAYPGGGLLRTYVRTYVHAFGEADNSASPGGCGGTDSKHPGKLKQVSRWPLTHRCCISGVHHAAAASCMHIRRLEKPTTRLLRLEKPTTRLLCLEKPTTRLLRGGAPRLLLPVVIPGLVGVGL